MLLVSRWIDHKNKTMKNKLLFIFHLFSFSFFPVFIQKRIEKSNMVHFFHLIVIIKKEGQRFSLHSFFQKQKEEKACYMVRGLKYNPIFCQNQKTKNKKWHSFAFFSFSTINKKTFFFWTKNEKTKVKQRPDIGFWIFPFSFSRSGNEETGARDHN